MAKRKPKPRFNSDINWGDRYADNWRQVTRFAHSLTHGRCTLCMIRKSTEVHHCYYKAGDRALAGGEVPGRDVFPMCEGCHAIAHHPKNWIKDKQDPKLGNHNTETFTNKLRANFKVLAYAVATNLRDTGSKKSRTPARR
jgi:hypothetical protein